MSKRACDCSVFRAGAVPLATELMPSVSAAAILELLLCLGHLVRRANAAVWELIKPGLEVERDGQGRLVRADLVVLCANQKDADEARKLLDPNRPRRKRRDQSDDQQDDSNQPPPRFANSYRLIAVEGGGDGGLPNLRFRLAYGEEQEEMTDDEASKLVWRVRFISSQFLQMIIVRWLRAPLLAQLPTSVRQGLGQEAAQQLLSHLGLQEEGSQEPSLPSIDGREVSEIESAWQQNLDDLPSDSDIGKQSANQQMTANLPPRPQTIRFIAADSATVWSDGRRLYAWLPVFAGISADSPLAAFCDRDDLYWWRHGSLLPLAPLKPWETVKKTVQKRQVEVPRQWDVSSSNGVLVPLRVRLNKQPHADGRAKALPRLAHWLSLDWPVSWSLLTHREWRAGRRGRGKRRSEWLFELIFRRPVSKPEPRPNILGVAPTRCKTGAGNVASCLDWALMSSEGLFRQGQILVDQIPWDHQHFGRRWRDNRKRLAHEAARKIVALAQSFDADLALLEIDYVAKRTRNPRANREATFWNFADLIRLIADKASEAEPPMRVAWHVHDSSLRKDRVSEVAKAAAVASRAWAALHP